MAPRILVLSASVGAGHIRAAQAVELALRQLRPDATVRNVDVLELTNVAFRRVYGQAYLDLVNRAPHVLGYFYDLLDRPSASGRNRGDQRVAENTGWLPAYQNFMGSYLTYLYLVAFVFTLFAVFLLDGLPPLPVVRHVLGWR